MRRKLCCRNPKKNPKIFSSISEEKQKESEEKSEEQAATKIQAAFRGHRTRKSMSMKTSKQQQQPEPQPTKAELEAEFRADDKGKMSVCDSVRSGNNLLTGRNIYCNRTSNMI